MRAWPKLSVNHSHIRLVLDLLDCGDRIEDNGFMLFLDFSKAFDKVEQPFMLDTLKHSKFSWDDLDVL